MVSAINLILNLARMLLIKKILRPKVRFVTTQAFKIEYRHLHHVGNFTHYH